MTGLIWSFILVAVLAPAWVQAGVRIIFLLLVVCRWDEERVRVRG